jgi:hypothetical protein
MILQFSKDIFMTASEIPLSSFELQIPELHFLIINIVITPTAPNSASAMITF